MLGRTYNGEVCSAARALELVGERWSLLIIRKALFAGATRFTEFQSLGVSTNILATRLDGFVAAGIMQRLPLSTEPVPSAQNTQNTRYVLTEMGRDLASVVIALTAWGDRWVAPDGAPVHYTHTGCGGRVTPQLACTDCGQVHSDDVHALPGPGMPPTMADAVRARAGELTARRG